MIDPSDLDVTPSGEYELDGGVETPPKPQPPAPLKRIWKAEDSDPEAETLSDRGKSASGAPPSRGKEPAATPRRAPASETPKRASKNSGPSPSASAKSDDPEDKKVLVEETPEWDTYETRRRARMLLGTGMFGFLVLVGWIGYRFFIYDPDAFDPSQETGTPPAAASTTAPSLDVEAMAMVDRAKEHEKAGRHNEAVSLLIKVTKTRAYEKTLAARAAKMALENEARAQPLFPDRPPTPVAALPRDAGVPPDGVPAAPADPSRGVPATTPNPDFNQVRPPDAAKGLAMATPAKPAVPAQPKPAPSIDALKPAPDPTPPKPKTNPLPRGFRARLEDGIDESGWPLVIECNLDGSRLVFIPEGTFVMGANGGLSVEAPAHRVRLRAYYIDQHEVTIAQYDKFLDDTGYRRILPKNWAPTDGKTATGSSMPVVMVNYKDAQSFAEWSGRQIPTEAQWEMAARSPKSHLYPWGSEAITWEKPRAFRQLDPVRTFPQDESAFGVFDLAGNAAEWTQDWFDLKYFGLFRDTVAIDPTGPAKGTRSLQRVVKGGAKNWSVTHREGIPQEKRIGTLGFRCVLNLGSASPSTPEPPADQGKGHFDPGLPVPF